MRLIFVSLFIAMLLVEPSIAELLIHGTIRERNKNYPMYFDYSIPKKGENSFPTKKYYRYIIYAYDLKYDDSVSSENRKYNLDDYRGIIETNLDLISSNEKTKTYKYKLSMKVLSLGYIGSCINTYKCETGGDDFPGTVKLDDGSPAVFFIEVTVGQDKKGRPMLTNSNNNKYFQLAFAPQYKSNILRLNLIKPYNIPVIIEGSYKPWLKK